MDVWMYGCMDVWMYGCMYGCMDVWMYECIVHNYMYVCIYIYISLRSLVQIVLIIPG